MDFTFGFVVEDVDAMRVEFRIEVIVATIRDRYPSTDRGVTSPTLCMKGSAV